MSAERSTPKSLFTYTLPPISTVKVPVAILRAVSISLEHERSCDCENCTKARFAVDDLLKEFRA